MATSARDREVVGRFNCSHWGFRKGQGEIARNKLGNLNCVGHFSSRRTGDRLSITSLSKPLKSRFVGKPDIWFLRGIHFSDFGGELPRNELFPKFSKITVNA
jgi:hypothetical protein